MIAHSIITGFNYFMSAFNGYICSKIYVDVSIDISSLTVCVENMSKFGSSSFSATQTQLETLLCDNICKTQNQYITYGLCQQQPQFSTLLLNSTVICEHPFVFNAQNDSCDCDFGFFLNISFCVNVIDQLSVTQKNATDLESTLRVEIQRTELELKTAFIGLEQLIISNITAFIQSMNENDLGINNNISSINATIHKNINDLRTENIDQFNTITGQIENKHTQTTYQLDSEFNGLTSTINDNQINIKNNFTAQKDQITDFRTNVQSILSLMDSHITNFQNDNKADLSSVNLTLKTKIDTQSTLINDNQLNIKNNFTAQKVMIDDFRANMVTSFTFVDKHITDIQTENKADIDIVKSKLDVQSSTINDNQINIKNNFTAQKDQITDFRTNVQSILSLMDSHITNFQNDNKADLSSVNLTLKTKIDTQSTLINDNQLNIKNNFTAQKDQITNLATSITARFTTLDSSVQSANTKLDGLKTQLTGSQISIESKINDVSTQIITTKTQLTDVQTYITNKVSTQQYLYDVYNSLLSAVNGIAAAQDPCKQWPGSINQGGICKCEYVRGDYHAVAFCAGWNRCCSYYLHENGSRTYNCYGMIEQYLLTECSGQRQYTNA
ncbi:Conserved_hypothetical protein [Hexamita inflata]|uniref:Uncharacterized protein n=1 Tax=Hexamita inflata TaxID=28002 RepID=A0AA86RC94_9EUKA|nr:Conserved hypothetical protein [Hexamita inflata]